MGCAHGDPGRHGGIYDDLAVVHPHQVVGQLRAAEGLEEVTGDSEAQRLEEAALVGIVGEDHHAERGLLGQQLGRRAESAGALESELDEHDVGVQPRRCRQNVLGNGYVANELCPF